MELYEHNKVTYDKAYKMLIDKGECAIDQATGTGKTFITMRLLETLFKDLKVLYVVPTLAIAEGITKYKEWDFNNVEFITYASLKNVTEPPDVLIVDELQRAGAPKYNTYVKSIKPLVAYTLGLSATPIRYLDNRRNMATELFGNNVVHGPNIYTAVRDGILPEFEYTVILGDVEKIRLDENLPPTMKMKLRKLDLGNYDLTERIHRHVGDRHKKAIVFFKNIAELQSTDNELHEWFGNDVPIYEMHARLGNARNKRNLDEFNQSEKAILKVVNIANEGLHLDGVTLVIFVRRTDSGNIFLQQTGRILSAKSTDIRPQVIDLVGNYQNLKSTLSMFQKSSNHKEATEEWFDKVIVTYDEIALKVLDIFNAVETVWEAHEDAILQAYWKSEGKEVFKRLKDRTAEDCLSRARTLGLCSFNRWTEEEDNILKEYHESDKDSLTFRLPGRTLSSIQARARKLGLSPKWSKEDLMILRFVDIQDLPRLIPDHTTEEIENKLVELGIPFVKN